MTTQRCPITAILHPEYVLTILNRTPFWTIAKNGRLYNAWKPEKYPFPCDVNARDDADLLNGTIFQLCYNARGGWEEDKVALSWAVTRPLAGGSRLRKALDLGCGSGLWVKSIAETFPSALVVGVDLAGGQDMSVRNAIWRVPNSPHGGPLDFEEDLSSLGAGTFDYIRMAHLNGSITNEGALLRKAFELSVPGTGHVEMTYIDWRFRIRNPDTIPASSPISRLQDLLTLASEKRGVSLLLDPTVTGNLLASAGFIDQIHRIHMIPLSDWSLDRELRCIGEQMKLYLTCAHPSLGCQCFLSGMAMELMTGWLGMQYHEVIELVVECVRYLEDVEHQVYVNLHTFTARRPAEQYDGTEGHFNGLHAV